MHLVVLDTDVLSYIIKRDSRAERSESLLRGRTPVISFMTVAELERWALTRKWGAPRATEMRALVREYVIYRSSDALCKAWAEVTASCQGLGRPIDCADAWIAATALELRCPLVTNNTRHFGHVPGIKLLTPA